MAPEHTIDPESEEWREQAAGTLDEYSAYPVFKTHGRPDWTKLQFFFNGASAEAARRNDREASRYFGDVASMAEERELQRRELLEGLTPPGAGANVVSLDAYRGLQL